MVRASRADEQTRRGNDRTSSSPTLFCPIVIQLRPGNGPNLLLPLCCGSHEMRTLPTAPQSSRVIGGASKFRSDDGMLNSKEGDASEHWVCQTGVPGEEGVTKIH